MSASAATLEDFEALLNESFELETPDEGTVVKGLVLAIEAGQAIIDIGYKMEGRVDLKEFATPGKSPEIKVGDTVEVYLDRVENARGEAVLSREKARREEAWDRLEKAAAKEERVEGQIFGRVKGGFTVDLGGAVLGAGGGRAAPINQGADGFLLIVLPVPAQEETRDAPHQSPGKFLPDAPLAEPQDREDGKVRGGPEPSRAAEDRQTPQPPPGLIKTVDEAGADGSRRVHV